VRGERDGALSFTTVPWCSGLAYVPVKDEIAGSNPVGTASLCQCSNREKWRDLCPWLYRNDASARNANDLEDALNHLLTALWPSSMPMRGYVLREANRRRYPSAAKANASSGCRSIVTALSNVTTALLLSSSR
jgi:hypothetical protein